MSTTKTQPQLLLHGRIPHKVLDILASSINPVEEVGGKFFLYQVCFAICIIYCIYLFLSLEHVWSIPNENSWEWNSDMVCNIN